MVNSRKRLEAEPDAWQRFERAIDAAIKSGPKHRTNALAKRTTGKGRAHLGKAKARKGRKEE